LGTALPDGVIVGARGDHYFLHPEMKDDAKLKSFVQKFRAKTNTYPIYPCYHMVAALEGVVAGYEGAMKKNGGVWPSSDQVAEVMHSLEFRGLTRNVKMREDGQGLEDQLLGVTKKVPEYPFPILDKVMLVPADLVTAPVGVKSPDWVKTLKPDLLASDRLKLF
jgi:branched-chain amino acid transport system substrate-binding protein